LNKLDATLSNVRMPWEEQGCISPVGSFSCWRRGRKGLWSLLGTQFYDCPISQIAWEPSSSILYSALQNGDIAGYRVDVTAKKPFKLAFEVKTVHTGRILCMRIDLETRRMYTTGVDKKIKVTDLAEAKVISELESRGRLNTLAMDWPNRRFFAAGAEKKILVIEISKRGQLSECMALSGHTSSIGSLHYFNKKGYLFSGGKDRMLGLWTIKNPRDVLMSEKIGFLKRGPPTDITKIVYLNEHKVIITGHGKGFVAVWYAEQGRVVMVFRAHRSTVTDLRWLEGAKVLMTSNHNCIRFWQFPQDMKICRTTEADAKSGNDEEIVVMDFDEFMKKNEKEGTRGPRTTQPEAEFEDDDKKHGDDAGRQRTSSVAIHKSPRKENGALTGAGGEDLFTQEPFEEEKEAEIKKGVVTEPEPEEEENEQDRQRRASSTFMRPSRRYVTPKEEVKAAKPVATTERTTEVITPTAEAVARPEPEAEAEPEPEPEPEGPEEGGVEVTVEEAKAPSDNVPPAKPEKKKIEEEPEEEDIFAEPKKGKKQETIDKFADLFGTGMDSDGSEQKKAMSSLFGDDDEGDIFS